MTRVLLFCLLSAFVPGTASAQDVSSWAGRWVAMRRGTEVVLWLELAAEDGHLRGLVMAEDERAGSMAITSASIEGRRVTLEVEPESEGETPGSLVLERAADGASLRVVGASLNRRRVRNAVLTRRDMIWVSARSQLLDMAHDDGGNAHRVADLRRYVALTDAVRDGLVSAGPRPELDTLRGADCAVAIADDAYEHGMSIERARAVAAAVAAANTDSVCSVELDDLSIPGVDDSGAACYRLVIADTDGHTTVRARPAARSRSIGTIPNGRATRVYRRRGAWRSVRVFESEGWVHDSNTRCLR